MAKKFRILSIDGGGLRGIIPVIILEELERITGKPIHEMFDLVAGTSTGGLIACALVKPTSIKDIKEVYTKKSKIIFPKENFFKNILRKINKLWSPEFNNDGLLNVVNSVVGSARMLDCKKPLFVTAYEVNNNEASFFKTRHAIDDKNNINMSDSNTLLSDICMATSAAPTYLPAWKKFFNLKDRTYVDGGMFMNNPSVGAIIEASKYHAHPTYNRPDMKFEDICVLSLGTGIYSDTTFKTSAEKGGELNWIRSAVDLMLQSSNHTVAYQAEELLEEGQYLRLNVNIDDKKYTDIADSSDDTITYWQHLVNKQIISDVIIMKKINDFIIKSELTK